MHFSTTCYEMPWSVHSVTEQIKSLPVHSVAHAGPSSVGQDLWKLGGGSLDSGGWGELLGSIDTRKCHKPCSLHINHIIPVLVDDLFIMHPT